VYEGQEIGMTNGDFNGLEELRDNESKNIYEIAKKLPVSPGRRLKMILRTTRDNARTPMQWTSGQTSGFSDGEPWLPVNANASAVNVETDAASEDSIIKYYKRLIGLRKASETLAGGAFERIPAPSDVFAFRRVTENETIVAVCSLSKHSRALFAPVGGEILAGNYFKETPDAGEAGREVDIEDNSEGDIEKKETTGKKSPVIDLKVLRPYEAVMIKVI
jgi:oligo-1,6-glucosidase